MALWSRCGVSQRWDSDWPRGIDLLPIGQHGENSIHWLDRSVTTDPRIPEKLYLDSVEWPQQTVQRLHHLHLLFLFTWLMPRTAQQYLSNIMRIANYKFQDIIIWVMYEESRRKGYFMARSSALNKFSMVKNLSKSVLNVAWWTTALKIIGLEEDIHKRARGRPPQKQSIIHIYISSHLWCSYPTMPSILTSPCQVWASQ